VVLRCTTSRVRYRRPWKASAPRLHTAGPMALTGTPRRRATTASGAGAMFAGGREGRLRLPDQSLAVAEVELEFGRADVTLLEPRDRATVGSCQPQPSPAL